MFSRMFQDIEVVMKMDPAARSRFEVFLTYAGLHAVWLHRIAHRCYRLGWFTLARAIAQFGRFMTGIEIHPGAVIGRGLFIDHGMGVVIGETAVVGDYVVLYQGVTLGGTGKEKGKRHPTIGNHVLIATGAKVLGSLTVGDYAKIGAGSVVLRSVPPNATVVGIPARVVVLDGRRVDELDQVNLPDVVDETCRALEKRIESLEKQLAELETRVAETGGGGNEGNVYSAL
ncbi:MAG: serine O-acetyltransferase [Bacilli bacterium]